VSDAKRGRAAEPRGLSSQKATRRRPTRPLSHPSSKKPPPNPTGAGGSFYSYSSASNPRNAAIKAGFAAAYLMAG